jgi:hypothetical protein
MLRRFRRLGALAALAVVVLGITPSTASAGDAVTISGKITDLTTGEPIEGACVQIRYRTESDAVCADDAGQYAITFSWDLVSIEVTADGYVSRFAHYYYPTSQTMDFTLVHTLPSATGVITNAAGAPVPSALVYFRPAYSQAMGVYTDAAGRYSIPELPAEPFTVEISKVGFPVQWVPGKVEQSLAQVFEPGDGEVLTINEQFLPYGRVTATFVDPVTRRLMKDLCMSDGLRMACSDEAGQAVLDLPAGSWQLSFTVPEAYMPGPAPVTVQVLQGQTINLKPVLRALRPSIVVDIVTSPNAPVPAACVVAVPVHLSGHPLGGQTEYQPACGTGDKGWIQLWLDEPGPVQLFAYGAPGQHTSTGRPKYGAQWIGEFGGTGDRSMARIINPIPYDTPAEAKLSLDAAVEFSGTVGVPSTEKVCVSAVALPLTIPGNAADVQVRSCSVAATTGSPTWKLSGLGPYTWPLLFTSESGRAQVWSGGAASRSTAVQVSQFASYHQVMPGLGGSVSGSVTGNVGGELVAYDAVTGDFVGRSAIIAGSYKITGLNERPVLLQYRPQSGPACWPSLPPVGTPPRAIPRTAVSVILGRTTTVALNVGQYCSPIAKLLAPVDRTLPSS